MLHGKKRDPRRKSRNNPRGWALNRTQLQRRCWVRVAFGQELPRAPQTRPTGRTTAGGLWGTASPPPPIEEHPSPILDIHTQI